MWQVCGESEIGESEIGTTSKPAKACSRWPMNSCQLTKKLHTTFPPSVKMTADYLTIYKQHTLISMISNNSPEASKIFPSFAFSPDIVFGIIDAPWEPCNEVLKSYLYQIMTFNMPITFPFLWEKYPHLNCWVVGYDSQFCLGFAS